MGCVSASEGGRRRELSRGAANGKTRRVVGKQQKDGSGGRKSRMKKVIVKSSSSSSSSAMTPVDASTTAQLWWRACKLPMYSVAWVPLACGAALAYCQFGAVNARQIAQLFLGSSLVIAWLNLTNDAFDSTTRVDESKPESVVRLLGGNARLVHAIAWSALAGGAALIGQACVASGSATSWRALVAAVMLGYAYQGPPFRLSYKGLGEPICFTAFGPLATVAFYLACASRVAGPGVVLTVPAVVSSVAVLVGCTTAFILFTSHFHQEDGDRAAGKLSPVVRLGLPGALLLADNLVGAHYAMIATLAAAGWLPYTAVFGLVITYPLARHIVDYAQKQYDDGEIDKLFFTKYLAVRYHVVHGVLLALGVVAQRLFLSPSLFFP